MTKTVCLPRRGGAEDNMKDKAVPDNTEGGGAVPTSDNTEAEDLKQCAFHSGR